MPGRIVRYEDGRVLTEEEARSGAFAFVALGDDLVAFDVLQVDAQLADWAARNQVESELAQARAEIEALPEDARALIDADAERAEVDALARRVDEFAARRDTPDIGSPDFLRRAHDEGVIHSAILYEKPGFLGATLTITTNLPDLRRVRDWPGGARSVEVRGMIVVALFEQANYGPVRPCPLWRLVGDCRLADTQRGIFSVLFI
jgi:hypothetical protein